MPIAPPSRRKNAVSAVTVPTCSRGTDCCTVISVVGICSPMPMPITTSIAVGKRPSAADRPSANNAIGTSATPIRCSGSTRPVRPSQRPLKKAAAGIDKVIGSRCSAAWAALRPPEICSRSGTSTDIAMKLKKQMNSSAQHATTVRFANSAIGTIASGWRRCCATKTRPSTSAMAQPTRFAASLHGVPCPTRVIGISSAVSAVSSSSAPTPSMRAVPRRTGRAFNALRTSASATMPTGRLIQKIHGHDRYSVSTPPITGPAMLATAQTMLM